jgi:hypothetical protein
VVGVLAIAGSAWAVVQTRTAATIDRLGWSERAVGGAVMDWPRLWEVGGAGPYARYVGTDPAKDGDEALVDDALAELVRSFDSHQGVDAAPRYAQAGWLGKERVMQLEGHGVKLRARAIAYARPVEGGAILVALLLPEHDVAALEPVIARILRSARVE